ncbi:hypothetical protein BJ742DRAFT_841601 [Cladochytrium replicatum]|nr:hypothetical protein BJ742DRAFT_841601 [Cladochytrium replicatum]
MSTTAPPTCPPLDGILPYHGARLSTTTHATYLGGSCDNAPWTTYDLRTPRGRFVPSKIPHTSNQLQHDQWMHRPERARSGPGGSFAVDTRATGLLNEVIGKPERAHSPRYMDSESEDRDALDLGKKRRDLGTATVLPINESRKKAAEGYWNEQVESDLMPDEFKPHLGHSPHHPNAPEIKYSERRRLPNTMHRDSDKALWGNETDFYSIHQLDFTDKTKEVVKNKDVPPYRNRWAPSDIHPKFYAPQDIVVVRQRRARDPVTWQVEFDRSEAMMTTHKHDFRRDGFDPDDVDRKMRDVMLSGEFAAGAPTKKDSHLFVGSEYLKSVLKHSMQQQDAKKNHHKHDSIFLSPYEQQRRAGVQHFTTDPLPPRQGYDRRSIYNKINPHDRDIQRAIVAETATRRLVGV